MPEVINDILGYDGLKVIQDSEKFNFSLDSTLLAHFVKPSPKKEELLDIGCGNGFIPLFLTLKTKNHITGVEIQKELYDLAKRSVALNNLEEQITIINEDIRTFYLKVGVSKYDVIISNPPYFKVSDESKLNKNDYLTYARHELSLTLEELVSSVKKLLKDNGKFYLVHRADRLTDIMIELRNNNLEIKRMQFVFPKVNSVDAYLVLIEAIKTKRQGGLKVLKPLYIHNQNGEYKKAILKIFNYQGDL